MSMVDVRNALEARLDAMSPALATAWENAEYKPVTGTPYQRVHMIPFPTDNPTLGDTQAMDSGILQVTLCYPELKGSKAALDRAGGAGGGGAMPLASKAVRPAS